MGMFRRGGKSNTVAQAGPTAGPPAESQAPEAVTPAQSQYASLGSVPMIAQAVPAAGHVFGTYNGQLHPVSAATIERLTGISQKPGPRA